MTADVITLNGVTKTYPTPAGDFLALDKTDLAVVPGEFVAVTGRSGSGKSTLLNLLAGIDRPTSGQIQVAGTDVHLLPESRLSSWRGRTIGMVFQFFQLLPTLTVAENVMLPMDFCATYPPRLRRPRAMELLERVGIAEQADKLPATLSGGQQQRAAIARALSNDPPVLLADEPTGNLDSATAEVIWELFAAQAASGTAVVAVTHERDLGRWAHRRIDLADGRIATGATR
ncbi:ABC transporter ATP-binding protein [Planomonospora sp. ID67723]|uniref:ABC transporter ATP-binding protein n=1 Tax=Planomonospora sp. ID67723 TaxID=2738134 RepID=UPI0018C3CA48|nr:ABC transporter ATP-binding protein [Planomonospora sp. ID67723]MBG0830059.1 ABC transporter ATP-binding protein [Planomonospora sp. ID67723]